MIQRNDTSKERLKLVMGFIQFGKRERRRENSTGSRDKQHPMIIFGSVQFVDQKVRWQHQKPSSPFVRLEVGEATSNGEFSGNWWGSMIWWQQKTFFQWLLHCTQIFASKNRLHDDSIYLIPWCPTDSHFLCETQENVMHYINANMPDGIEVGQLQQDTPTGTILCF